MSSDGAQCSMYTNGSQMLVYFLSGTSSRPHHSDVLGMQFADLGHFVTPLYVDGLHLSISMSRCHWGQEQ